MSNSLENKENQVLSLQLGDIIRIKDATNDVLNKKVFFIEYIDATTIKLIESKDLSKIKLIINGEGIIEPGTIESIDLLYRNEIVGYARQNGYLPGTWITIFFGEDIPLTITGEITNLEEDMIEIKIYPENNIIYINFSYNGIPQDLNITSIKIRNPPQKIEEEKENVEENDKGNKMEEDVGKEKNDDIIDDAAFYEEYEDLDFIEPLPTNQNKELFIIKADEIQFGKKLGSIKQSIDVDSSQQRYTIDTQTTDLCNELLSKIPFSKRNFTNINNVHKLIERFIQLRKEFSVFDINGNVVDVFIKNANWKPLVADLKQFKTLLYWIVPIVKNMKKVYDINAKGEGDLPDVIPSISTFQLLSEIKDVIDIYKSNSVPDDRNKYVTLNNNLTPYFRPFEEVETYNDMNVISKIKVLNDMNVIVDNLDGFMSSTVSNGSIVSDKFVVERYTSGLTWINELKNNGINKVSNLSNMSYPDILSLKSILTLPEPMVRFSRINLPSTNILDRSNLANNFIHYWQLLKQNTIINNIIVDNEYVNKTDDNEGENNFVNKIKNYMVSLDEGDLRLSNEELLTNYLEKIIPKTVVLFKLVKKYIIGKLSLNAVVGYLEPFLIYTSDLTFFQYKEIIKFLDEEISKYNIKYLSREKSFKTLFNKLKELSKPISCETLVGLLNENIQLKNDVLKNYTIINGQKSNSELLTDILKVDYGNAFMISVSLENIKLMFPEDITTIIEKNKELLSQSIEAGKNENKCVTYVIAKQYLTETELKNDNGKTIYFDKKFDTTDYNIFEDKNGRIDKDIDRARNILSNEDYNLYLVDILQRKFKYNELDANYMVETLLNKLKKVVDGNIAILFEENKFNYYRRVDNIWKFDDTISEDIVSDSQNILCNLQTDCIENAKMKCESMDLNKKELFNSTLKEIITEFDKKYQESKEKMEILLNSKYNYSTSIIDKLKQISQNRILKNNNFQYNLGTMYNTTTESNEGVEIIVSPFKVGMDLILGQPDFVKKQNDIIRFTQKFTRDPIRNMFIEKEKMEDVNWKYCIQTNTKLMPLFLYELALCYIENPDMYNKKMDEVIQLHGKISDDGNEWVVDYCGYNIRKINLELNEGYDEKGRIVSTNAVLEDDIIKIQSTITINKINIVYKNPNLAIASNIINTLSTNMNISLDTEKEFIMKIINTILPIALISEENYQMKIAEMAKKGKRIMPYKEMKDEILLYSTFGAFLIGIQSSIPSIITRKTYPGCIRSFEGFPLDGGEDYSLLNYLSCVVFKSKSNIEPWAVLRGKKNDEILIASRIKKIIETYYLSDIDVKDKFLKKSEYLGTIIIDNKIPNIHDLSRWTTFLPPLMAFNINKSRLLNITSEFKRKFLDELKSGSPYSLESFLTIKSRIIFFSLAIQEIIQNIIKKKDLLLKNSQSEPYIENSCCNENILNDATTAIDYFNNIDSNIFKYNDIIKELSNIIYDIINITKSPYLFSKEKTKRIYPVISNEMTEETVYIAFIKLCHFHSLVEPINKNLKGLCKEKPTFLSLNESINNKIKKLKENGYNYGNDDLLRLLQITGRQNIVHISVNNIKPSPIQKIQKVLYDIKNMDDETVIPKELITRIEAILDTYDVAITEDTQDIRNLKNYLYKTNEGLKEKITEFINNSSSRVLSTSKKQKTNKIINNLLSWTKLSNKVEQKKGKFINKGLELEVKVEEYNTISDNTTYNLINFIKSYSQNIIKTFPNIIINNVSNGPTDIMVPAHTKLALGEILRIKNLIGSYYERLHIFYGNANLNNLLLLIQKKCANLLILIENTPYMTDIKYDGNTTYSIFNKTVSTLLFENYFLLILNTYITLSNDLKTLTPEIINKNLKPVELELVSLDYLDDMVNENIDEITPIQSGDLIKLKDNVESIIDVFLNIMNDHKSISSLSYDLIMEYVFKERNKEKNKMTDILNIMTDDERSVNNIQKVHKLGMWGKGLKKGLTVYTKDMADEDRDQMIENANTEKQMILKGFDNEDYEEENEARREEAEEFDIGNLTEDYEAGGDYGGAMAEDEDYPDYE